MEILNITAWELRNKIINKEVSVREVTQAYLDRIKEVDGEINSFITINEAALEDAKRLDEKIARGEKLGSLVGLPIGVKDNISTKGLRTTAASKVLENYIPPFDSQVVRHIKEEDGIIIGKTNLDEFAMGSSSERSYFGITRNPVDKTKLAGGSSSGSASAIKARECLLTLGTDTGGSVRQPAALCEVVGIKPSYGVISRYGVIDMAGSLDHVGVFGRDVKDTSIILKALMKGDSKDSTSYEKSEDILKDLDFKEGNLAGKKFGLIKEILDVDMDQGVRERFLEALELIKSLGAEIEEVSLEHIVYSGSCYSILTSSEISSNMARYDGVRFGHRTEDYSDLEDLYTKSRSESFGPTVKRLVIQGLHFTSGENREKYYMKALRLRRVIKEEIDRALGEYDFLLCPTSGALPFDSFVNKGIESLSKDDIFTIPFNLSGSPALSLPMGRYDGLPTGLQIVGPNYGEKELLEVGYIIEGGLNNEF